MVFSLEFMVLCGGRRVVGEGETTVADPDARERELSYLRCVMPESLLEFAHVEVPAIENIAIRGEGAEQYLGLHLFPGQKKLNKGIRAEISVDQPHRPGDTVRYAWRFMVPQGFQSDAPQNRWSHNPDGRAVLFLDDLTITTQTAR